MKERIRQRIAKFFEVSPKEDSVQVKLLPIFIWIMIAGFIGGITLFLFITNHGLLTASTAAILFMILTVKLVKKKCIYYDE